MGPHSRLLFRAMMVVLVPLGLSVVGCTFYLLPEGDRLTRRELGWEPSPVTVEEHDEYALPSPEELAKIVARLGTYQEAPSFWRRFAGRRITGADMYRLHEWVLDPPLRWLISGPNGIRDIYIVEFSGPHGSFERAYDIESRELLACRDSEPAAMLIFSLLGLLFHAEQTVLPVGPDGESGLEALLSANVSTSDVHYEWKEGWHFLAGVVGGGRVNRTQYFQLLWIPIPIGEVELPIDDLSCQYPYSRY